MHAFNGFFFCSFDTITVVEGQFVVELCTTGMDVMDDDDANTKLHTSHSSYL